MFYRLFMFSVHERHITQTKSHTVSISHLFLTILFYQQQQQSMQREPTIKHAEIHTHMEELCSPTARRTIDNIERITIRAQRYKKKNVSRFKQSINFICIFFMKFLFNFIKFLWYLLLIIKVKLHHREESIWNSLE